MSLWDKIRSGLEAEARGTLAMLPLGEMVPWWRRALARLTGRVVVAAMFTEDVEFRLAKATKQGLVFKAYLHQCVFSYDGTRLAGPSYVRAATVAYPEDWAPPLLEAWEVPA